MKFDVRFYSSRFCSSSSISKWRSCFPGPWRFKAVGAVRLLAVMVFLGVLTIGFVYEWKKGASEWE